MAEADEPKTRLNPRMSVNGLSEYLVAGASRRRRIIQDQKRPKGFQVPYYTEVEDAISKFLASPEKSLVVLDEAEAKLREVATKTRGIEWELTRRATGIEALQAFRDFSTEDLFVGSVLTRGPLRPRHLQLNGVGISVRPEILLTSSDKEPRLGGVKLYFSKSAALTEDRAHYAGTILHHYLEAQQQRNGKVDYRRCLVVDVFAKRIFAAPRTFKRRRADIEAACAEIALTWEIV